MPLRQDTEHSEDRGHASGLMCVQCISAPHMRPCRQNRYNDPADALSEGKPTNAIASRSACSARGVSRSFLHRTSL